MSNSIKRIDLFFNLENKFERSTFYITKHEKERKTLKYKLQNSFFQNELNKLSYYRTINNGQPIQLKDIIGKNSLPISRGLQSSNHSKRFINLLNIKKNILNESSIFKRTYSCEFLDSSVRKTNRQFYPIQYRSERMMKWEGLGSNNEFTKNENKNFVLSSNMNRDFNKLKMNLLHKGKSAAKIIKNKFIQQKIKDRKTKYMSNNVN